MNIKFLLIKYASLNSFIESKGGREVIEGNDELEKIYEQVFVLENDILEKCNLPQLIKFRLILIDFTDRNKVEEVLNALTVASAAFSN